MNIFRTAWELFLLYLLYKFIFDFIIPVFTATKKVKKQFNDMQSKMNEQMQQFEARQNNTQQRPKPQQTKLKEEQEYIDFEES